MHRKCNRQHYISYVGKPIATKRSGYLSPNQFRNAGEPPIRNDTNGMGLISTSERDVKRLHVLAEVRAGKRTVEAVLDLGVRQTFRLMSRYEAGGAGALIHQARGRASNRQLSAGIREYAVELVRTKYADFGPTLATEILQEKHSISIGRETLRRLLMADGLWLSRKQHLIPSS